MRALGELFRKNDDLHFIMAGGSEELFEIIPIAEHEKTYMPWMRHDDWPKTLAMFDIGLIPLAGEYDARRSWNKAIEYLVMGIPWVGSISPALDDAKEFGVTVINSAKTWERALQLMINDLERL